MPHAPSTEPMPVQQSMLLADFARTCKAAARAVSLYPGSHPAIGSSVARLVASAARLAGDGRVKLAVHGDLLVIDGRSPLRPDPAVGELASLLHERLIGTLTVERSADAEDWRALLLLLARTPEDLMVEGGIGQAWTRTGRSHFHIREIDYAEVLRERGGARRADWNRIIAFCLRTETGVLDDQAVASLLHCLGDPEEFAQLVEALHGGGGPADTSVDARVAALMQLMRTAIDAARTRGEADVERALDTIADSWSRLTPELMVAVLAQRTEGAREAAALATTIASRMTDQSIASFLARSVTVDRGATDRLSQALASLAPPLDRRTRIVQLAKPSARAGTPGKPFEQMWEDVVEAVMSYTLMTHTDAPFVAPDYARELSAATVQAIDVERVSDDPPARVSEWIASVSDPAMQQLDAALLLDLLRLQDEPLRWEPIAAIAVSEAERRTLAGDFAGALALVDALTRETRADARAVLRTAAAKQVERLAAGPLARHVALHCRTAPDADVQHLARMCERLGPALTPALADALAREEHQTSIRRLGDLLLRFGGAGRRSIEPLKNSPNVAIRRTAVSLLRRSRGQEALLELASMIGDADPEVQREAIHAMVEMGTTSAYSVLHRLLLEADTPRDTALRELLALRDEKAVPLFSYVLMRSEPRRSQVAIHVSMIEALGAMHPRSESVRALQHVLMRGGWWTPFRTWTIRQAAAAALRRLGTPEALAALERAARAGRRGVRRLARAQIAMFPAREKASGGLQ